MRSAKAILIVILAALLFAVMPLAAQGTGSAGAWTIESLGAVGMYVAGPSVGGYYTFPCGAVLGVTVRALFDSALDDVTGLTDYFHIYCSPSAEAGWEFDLPYGFALAARLFAGGEVLYLTERIVDPAHGIDRSYSSSGLIFDSGLSLVASWMFIRHMGVCVSFQLSFYDLRKSTLSLGLRFGLSPASP